MTQRAALSKHKHAAIAREGRGWVEVYLVLRDMELPRRPPHYEGLQLGDEEVGDPIFFRWIW